MTRRDRRQGRVVESRRIVLAAFRLGGAFGLVSLGWSQDGPAPLPRSDACPGSCGSLGGLTDTGADQALRGPVGGIDQETGADQEGNEIDLPDSELALFEESRFDGFFESLGEMVEDGSKGAYWDARVFLGDWGFDCRDIEVPVSLFYGTADKNVPLAMGEYYQRSIPDSKGRRPPLRHRRLGLEGSGQLGSPTRDR